MKQLTGSMPIAALPESTAAFAKQQLLATIDWLQREGATTETNLKLLTAIVESILWSEESYTRFLQAGLMLQLSYLISLLKTGSLKNQRHHLTTPEIGTNTSGLRLARTLF
ncbi:hypothetical protein [Komarekiella delphini-convector]|uniref:hypothetical protein n=1 Tax=Komarekiella delphini-convector TaxID=3050158 RepID=UPI001CD8F6B6|nr:hypothetical protein [Komarekiella delphini-convector]